MAFDVGAIVGRLTLDDSKFIAGMRKAKGEVRALGGLIEKNGAKIKRFGRSMTVAGAAIVGGLGVAVKAWGNFDEAMVKSLAIMGDVPQSLRKEMAKTAKELSTTSTFAAKELASAYFFLASAGMDAAQSIKALPVVARFAQAGSFDLARATDLLTDAQTALGLSSKDAAVNQTNLIKVSDVLVKANTLANASVEQFSESLTNKSAAALVNVNKRMEEGVAVLAAYADKGVKGQIAGSRLAMMLNALDIAARQNKKAWDKLGISLFDNQGEMRNIADLIGDMEALLGNMTTEQKTATLATLGFNVRTKDSILTLMGSSEKIRQWEKDLKNAGGTTETVAKKQLEAFNAKMTIAKNKVMLAVMAIGKSLAPVIVSLSEKVKNVAGKISAWIEKHPELTGWITKLALGIGGLLAVLGPFAMMLPGIAMGIKGIGIAMSFLAAHPAALLVVALAAIVAKFIQWRMEQKKVEAMQIAHDKLTKASARHVMAAIDLIGETKDKYIELRKEYGGNTQELMKNIRAGKHGVVLKEALIKVLEEEKRKRKALRESQRAQREAEEEGQKALAGVYAETTQEISTLMAKMEDEIFAAAHSEFEVRTRLAYKAHDERENLLKDEQAGKEAFALNEKLLAIELEQIEKDRTEKSKEAWKTRGKAIMAGLLKWQALQKKYLSFVARYTGIIKKLTLSEKNYKLYQAEEWYNTEIDMLKKQLQDKLITTAQFYKAMAVLDEAYAKKRDAIQAASFTATVRKILGGVSTVISALDGIFSQHHENEAMRIDNEEKQRTDALEVWFEQERARIEATVMGEEEKVAALEALDEEKARKENALQHQMDKERRKLERKRAQQQKVSALFTAGINVAEAITKALTAGPLIGQIFAGIVAALGMVQMAAIAAAPLPALAKGAIFERPTYLVGEGREPEVLSPLSKLPELFEKTVGRQQGGARMNFNFYGPIISTTGLSNRDLDKAVEYFFLRMKTEAGRYGVKLNA